MATVVVCTSSNLNSAQVMEGFKLLAFPDLPDWDQHGAPSTALTVKYPPIIATLLAVFAFLHQR
jgi:hypothetical protein